MLFVSPIFKHLEKTVLPRGQHVKKKWEIKNLLWSMTGKSYTHAFKYLSHFQIENTWKNCP